MKRLTLFRHGHAQAGVPGVSDFARPLSARGLKEVSVAAATLLAADLIPDLLIVSPARRTRETAEILRQTFKLPARVVKQDGALYLASSGTLLKIVHGAASRIGHVMIVGHNPGLSELADILTGAVKRADMPTAAACTMSFAVRSWKAIKPGTATDVRREYHL